MIYSSQILEAMQESVAKIVDLVKMTLEKTPPELSSDIMEKGIILAGGGALIQNLDKLLIDNTGLPVYVAAYIYGKEWTHAVFGMFSGCDVYYNCCTNVYYEYMCSGWNAVHIWRK